jgi:hypothetical protein
MKFREKHEAYKTMLKTKDLDDNMRDRIKKNFFNPANIFVIYKAMYKTADLALYDAKRDGRNKAYLFDFERDYSSKNLHAVDSVELTDN